MALNMDFDDTEITLRMPERSNGLGAVLLVLRATCTRRESGRDDNGSPEEWEPDGDRTLPA